jgi:hypothetical protein
MVLIKIGFFDAKSPTDYEKDNYCVKDECRKSLFAIKWILWAKKYLFANNLKWILLQIKQNVVFFKKNSS